MKALIGSNNYNKKSNRIIKYKSSYSPIGIDIGSSMIKIIQLQQNKGRLLLAGRSMIPTPEGTICEGKIIDPGKLSYKLSQLKKKLNLKGNRANLCLGPESHYLRLIELPPLSKKDLKKTLPWEIEKHFLLKADNAVYACCPVNGAWATEKGAIKYILAAAEADSSAALTAAAEKAGFTPLSLEISPLSLLRLEMLNQDGRAAKRRNGIKALLDIGYRNSTLLLAGKDVLQYHRQLKIGVLDFLKEASFINDFNLTEAERYIFKHDALAVGSILKSAELLAGQVTNSVGYYLDQPGSGGREPDLFSVSGGGAMIPGLVKFLYSKLSIKVELMQPPAYCPGKEENSINAGQAAPAIYATAFGLALRGWLK